MVDNSPMEPTNTRTDILALMRELDAMPAKSIVDERNSLAVSMYVYGRNYQRFVEFSSYFKDDPANQDIWHSETRRKSEYFHLETSRLLQNCVASVEALLEHTDKIYQRLYRDGGLMPSYAARERAFRGDPIVSFVQSLRNVVLHGETAKTMFRVTIGDEWCQNAMGLPREFLLKHKNWFKGASRSYIAGVEEFVDIPELLADYNSKVDDFMLWFTAEMQRVSAPEFQLFAEKERELFLVQIEDTLDAWFRNPNPVTHLAPGDAGLFHGLFDEREYRELDAFPEGSVGRADRAIEILGQFFSVPDRIQNKIRRAYLDPEFFRFDALRPRVPGNDSGTLDGSS